MYLENVTINQTFPVTSTPVTVDLNTIKKETDYDLEFQLMVDVPMYCLVSTAAKGTLSASNWVYYLVPGTVYNHVVEANEPSFMELLAVSESGSASFSICKCGVGLNVLRTLKGIGE